MSKFFVSPENISQDKIVINNTDVSHITKVLRMNIGDKITVCDSMGYDYLAKISGIEQNSIICDILSKEKSNTEPNINVTIFQGLPKASKMDYIIQKTTELGISKIVPCALKRCVVKLDGKKAEAKKCERWQKISEEASKQSGRGIVPAVEMPMTLKEVLNTVKDYDLFFVPYECEEQTTIKEVLTSLAEPKNIAFMIGPEGGFDTAEIEEIKKSGVKTVTLGKRILRTETAGEAVLAMIMYEIGDINV
ncbi:MAG: 16S rRNA (uracil(1498)-N(3))-methyltransferase [Clostridia bacterium]|nr:16S rRNA (uracil(1498)-N(3))-methyltransferase [Clostridia bacterium]